MTIDPFFENFYYPKVKPLTRSKIFFRRCQQLTEILFSKKFKNPKSIAEVVTEHYSQAEEIKFYEAYAKFGFHGNEKEALEHFLSSNSAFTTSSAAVVGCGAGREAFALDKTQRFSNILGIDSSLQMIEAAKSLNNKSHIHFKSVSLNELSQKFDLIWVTSILESHIQGRSNRIQFFKEIRKHLKPNGQIVLTPLIRPLHWRSLYFWSSQLLHLRWMKTGFWEKGDVLLSNFGAHNKNEHLVFSHFYPDRSHFKSELTEAGFNKIKELPQETWIVSF